MQAADNTPIVSLETFLQGEQAGEIRHELVEGVVYAMAGASRNHEHIVQNIARLYGVHLLDSPCAPFGSNTLLKTPAGNMRYPDYIVVCEQDDNDAAYIEQPVLLVEVISNSTRKTDQQTKRLKYINISTLKEYVLIEQDFVNIIIYRQRDQWRPTHYFLDDNVTFESIGSTLSVAQIYHRVDNPEMAKWLMQQAT